MKDSIRTIFFDTLLVVAFVAASALNAGCGEVHDPIEVPPDTIEEPGEGEGEGEGEASGGNWHKDREKMAGEGVDAPPCIDDRCPCPLDTPDCWA